MMNPTQTINDKLMVTLIEFCTAAIKNYTS